eukprot:2219229-Rhodomonas_salina.1
MKKPALCRRREDDKRRSTLSFRPIFQRSVSSVSTRHCIALAEDSEADLTITSSVTPGQSERTGRRIGEVAAR